MFPCCLRFGFIYLRWYYVIHNIRVTYDSCVLLLFNANRISAISISFRILNCMKFVILSLVVINLSRLSLFYSKIHISLWYSKHNLTNFIRITFVCGFVLYFGQSWKLFTICKIKLLFSTSLFQLHNYLFFL